MLILFKCILFLSLQNKYVSDPEKTFPGTNLRCLVSVNTIIFELFPFYLLSSSAFIMAPISKGLTPIVTLGHSRYPTNNLCFRPVLPTLEWGHSLQLMETLTVRRIYRFLMTIKVITKLPNSEQSYKGKVKTHNYIPWNAYIICYPVPCSSK